MLRNVGCRPRRRGCTDQGQKGRQPRRRCRACCTIGGGPIGLEEGRPFRIEGRRNLLSLLTLRNRRRDTCACCNNHPFLELGLSTRIVFYVCMSARDGNLWSVWQRSSPPGTIRFGSREKGGVSLPILIVKTGPGDFQSPCVSSAVPSTASPPRALCCSAPMRLNPISGLPSSVTISSPISGRRSASLGGTVF
jgi:hypothetical protein